MTPTPTRILGNPRGGSKASKTKVKIRKRVLDRAGVTYAQLAGAADVSYSMIYKWVNGGRTSAVIADAYEKLTGTRDGI